MVSLRLAPAAIEAVVAEAVAALAELPAANADLPAASGITTIGLQLVYLHERGRRRLRRRFISMLNIRISRTPIEGSPVV